MIRSVLMRSLQSDGAITSGNDISTSLLTASSSGTNGAAFVTASIAPSANTLLLLAVSSTAAVSGDNVVPTVAGNGLTWVEVDNAVTDTNWGRVSLFRAMGASPSAGATTITFSATQNDCLWEIRQWANVDTSGTNGSGAIVQSVDNRSSSATSLTVTLAAFGSANNATFGVFGRTDQ